MNHQSLMLRPLPPKVIMNKIFFTILLSILFFPALIFSQNEPASFPNDWLGEWEGKLMIYNQKGLASEIDMELHILDMDSVDRWKWVLIYKGEKLDERKYELVAIDTKAGHYQIDEKNSILLDAYWRDQTLISRFSVDNSLLLVNYHFEKEQIRFEIFAGGMTTAVQTGKEVKEIDEIKSFPVGVMQKATLKQKK